MATKSGAMASLNVYILSITPPLIFWKVPHVHNIASNYNIGGRVSHQNMAIVYIKDMFI